MIPQALSSGPIALRPASGVPAASYAPVAAVAGASARTSMHGFAASGQELLRLDANEGIGPSAAWLEQTLRDLANTAGGQAGGQSGGLVRSYPGRKALAEQIAEMLRVPSQRVLVTAGADDALDRAAGAMLAGEGVGERVGERVGKGVAEGVAQRVGVALTTTPTFEMIGRYIALRGGRQLSVPWLEGDFPAEVIVDAIASTAGLRVVFVVSPNNPTGGVATREQVERVWGACVQRGVLLVIDQAYGEFGGDDLTGAFIEREGVVITRTLSKAWGLAGLRVGFACGDPRVLGWMDAAGQPYAASGVSLALAGKWLAAGQSEVDTYVQRCLLQRGVLSDLLSEMGAAVVPSAANFVFAAWPSGRAELVAGALCAKGILVRSFTQGPAEGALRITLPGTEAGGQRLMTALGEIKSEMQS